MPDTEPNTVRITFRDVYDEVQKHGHILETLVSSLPTKTKQLADHEIRIRRIEVRVGWAVGALGFIAAIMPLVINLST